MIKKILILFSLSLFLFGCAIATTPVSGFLFTDVQAPLTATSNPSYSKVGKATCSSILGWIALGDCSIETAAKNAKITKIHHVDYKTQNFLGIYATFTVYVYGE